MRISYSFLMCLALTFQLAPAVAFPAAGDDAFLGKWDITMPAAGQAGSRALWIDITREGGVLKGLFQSGGGAAFPLPRIGIENGELMFQHPQRRRDGTEITVTYRAQVKNGRLEGTATYGDGPSRTFVGVRPPVWPERPPAKKPGRPVELFNGKDVSGWLAQGSGKPPKGWYVKDGILTNEMPADNIYSEMKFNDFKIDLEFTVDKESNSGLYLRGRYEIQIRDSHGRPLDVHSQGALYGFKIPSVDACKPAGEWQKLEATLVANRVTVVLNGTKIIDNFAIPGITGGALDSKEGEPGPIMLQGDHGKVQFRRVTVTPLE
ncbi:MAG: DUF1080 domain-containing protein [Acidobacteria bacterium]|nr:DUF1080 domain-containing protein [Acidobacteriota bacterium]